MHYQGRYKRYLLSGLITIPIIQNINSKKVKVSNHLFSIASQKFTGSGTRNFYSFAMSPPPRPRFYIPNNFSIHCAINVHFFLFLFFVLLFFFFFTFKKHRSCFNAAREYSIETKIKRKITVF